MPEKTNIIIAECREVGPNEPLTREKLSPVLAMIKADSTEQGLKFAEEMVAFDGLGHSAAIHTANEELVKTFGSRVKALRVIWNSPSTFGGIGDVYNAFLPSLTLGCGSYGKKRRRRQRQRSQSVKHQKSRPSEKQHAMVQSARQNLF